MTSPNGVPPAAVATEGERAQARAWAEAHLTPAAAAPPNLPFSFTYGGQPSATLLAAWPCRDEVLALDQARTQRTLCWRDATTGLEVRCVAVAYRDFPVVEWTVFWRNTGVATTPVLASLQGLDLGLENDTSGEFVLHGIQGDSCTPDSFEPFDRVLGPGSRHAFAAVGGRPTNGAFPCVNLEFGGGGLIVAVGWPGQWASTYTRDAGRRLTVRAGQEQTHLVLAPGEEVRTPLSVLLWWQGEDLVRAQNLWRRWMLAHNTPSAGGRPPGPLFCFCDGAFFPGLKCNATDEMQALDTLHRQGIQLDYWWMDAGWYPGQDWAQGVGTWEPDPERFPQGIRPVADHARAYGAGLVLWFEPERVMPGTWLAQTHPEWLLGQPGGVMLLDLGQAAARTWLTEHVDRLIESEGITLYRQDFNMDPLPYWRANDAPDRQGMTENLHVQGYLAYWDELRRRHPGMLIDSCASGGRRNDLETLRRSVPLLRSDYQSFGGDSSYAAGNQLQTYGLSRWLPYYGTGVYLSQDQPVYAVRSYLCPAFGIAADPKRVDVDWDLYRRLVAQWRQVADCFLGDYYPLTGWGLSEEAWMGWQFDLAEQGRGMVQVFRRTRSPFTAAVFPLQGLDPEATYAVRDLDQETPALLSGRQLMEPGLEVRIDARPAARMWVYTRVGA